MTSHRWMAALLFASASTATAQVEQSDEQAAPQAPADAPADAQSRIAALEARLAELEARTAAQTAPAASADEEAERDAEGEGERAPPTPATYTLGGWAEAYYAYNFNQPSHGITALRGFDNRHNSFNLSNVVLDAQWDVEGVHGRISLQWGSTPWTYYLAETRSPSLGSGVGEQSQELWQVLQQANVGYRIPIGSGLNVQAGLFLSPIGAEAMAVKDNWFYSRSNLFYGYPFYHTGIRVSYPITPELSVIAWGINGWNTVLDNNEEKSVILQATYSLSGLLSSSLLYVFGVERPAGAPEGRAWRHLWDLNATLTPIPWLGLQGQITGGFEPNAFGTSGFFAGALAARVQPISWIAIAVRGDVFYEHVATNTLGTASPIFWPVEWVSSVTGTVELRPHEHFLLRLEYRHDHGGGLAYYAGSVAGNGADMPYVFNAQSQDTLTLGTTAWF
ncbi:MAG: porin [Sandaracinaceae bacterium]|nr:porin [Sandaracinaceae bacterium]